MIGVKTKEFFWRFTLKDILSIVCSAAIPLALALYAATNYKQQQEQAEKALNFDRNQTDEARQQKLYDKFLNNIYKLDKNGYLQPNKTQWAFANAYYRAAHRNWDNSRKADVLQFLHEKQLIGRANCSETCRLKSTEDIIRLDELSFDNVSLTSEIRLKTALFKLNCVPFDRVSWINGLFSFIDLSGTSFDGARLTNTKFINSILKCSTFINTELDGVDFGDADLQDALFANVNLSTAKLTQKQYEQAFFYNVTFPPGLSNRIKIRTTEMPTKTTTQIPTTTPCSNVTETTTVKLKTKVFKSELFSNFICDKNGQLITFDDLSTNGSIPDGYQNLHWKNGFYGEKNLVAGQNDEPLILISYKYGQLFSLKSCVAAALWNDNLQIQVVGYRYDRIVANETFVLNVLAGKILNFHGFTKTDQLIWKATDGIKNEFAMDNLCLEFH